MTTESHSEDSTVPELEQDRANLAVKVPMNKWLLSSARSGWFLLVLLLLIELISFHRMVVRDIEGMYPFSYDQTTYLLHSYQAFETIRNQGFVAGMQNALFGPGHPTGVLLQSEAALTYIFLGASRTTSLLLLFLHFAVLQLVLFAAFRHLTKRNAPGWIAVSLVLLSTSRFFHSGGQNDFRLDHPASCLYGIALCAFLCSDQFRNKRWTILFVVSIVALVTTRFVSASYASVAIILCVALYAVRTYSVERSFLAVWRNTRPALIACSIAATITAIFIFPNMTEFVQYYALHISGPEKAIRAAEAGVGDKLTALLFYPRSLVLDHLGFVFGVAAFLLLVFSVASRLTGFCAVDKASRPEKKQFVLLLIVTLIWIAIPLIFFASDESKSPVVVGVLVVPVVIFLSLLYLVLSGRNTSGHLTNRFSRLEQSGILLFLGVACLFGVSLHSRRDRRLQMQKDATALYAIYNNIAAGIDRNNLKQPKFATDSNVDYFSGGTIRVMTYEKTSRLVDTQELLATTILAIPKASAMAAMEQADYALVTLESPSIDRNSVFPFQRSMIEYRRDLLEYARNQMIPIGKAQVAEHLFQVFERPHVEIFGTSGGWLTNTGASLQVEVSALKKLGHILLSGPTMNSREFKDGLRCNAFLLSADYKERLPLKTIARIGNDEYTVAIDATPATSRREDLVEIELEFPTYFVPVERGINIDTRKLAVSVPQVLRLVSGPSSYPPALAAIAAKP